MKKYIAALSAVVLLALESSSFGVVTFPQAALSLNSFDNGGTVLAVGGAPSSTFFVQIFAGINAGAMFAVDSIGSNPLSSTITGSSGGFDGNYGYVPTAAPDTTGFVQVFAWEGASTFAAATIKGQSAILPQAFGRDAGTPNFPAPTQLVNFGAIQLAVVPEPSTIALGVLGGLGLLLRRRK